MEGQGAQALLQHQPKSSLRKTDSPTTLQTEQLDYRHIRRAWLTVDAITFGHMLFTTEISATFAKPANVYVPFDGHSGRATSTRSSIGKLNVRWQMPHTRLTVPPALLAMVRTLICIRAVYRSKSQDIVAREESE